MSGRYLLVLEAARLLDLEELGDVFNWKVRNYNLTLDKLCQEDIFSS